MNHKSIAAAILTFGLLILISACTVKHPVELDIEAEVADSCSLKISSIAIGETVIVLTHDGEEVSGEVASLDRTGIGIYKKHGSMRVPRPVREIAWSDISMVLKQERPGPTGQFGLFLGGAILGVALAWGALVIYVLANFNMGPG